MKYTFRQLKTFRDYFEQNITPLIKKLVNFKVAITEMYPRIPWELVADHLGSVEHSLATTYPEHENHMGMLSNLD